MEAATILRQVRPHPDKRQGKGKIMTTDLTAMAELMFLVAYSTVLYAAHEIERTLERFERFEVKTKSK